MFKSFVILLSGLITFYASSQTLNHEITSKVALSKAYLDSVNKHVLCDSVYLLIDSEDSLREHLTQLDSLLYEYKRTVYESDPFLQNKPPFRESSAKVSIDSKCCYPSSTFSVYFDQDWLLDVFGFNLNDDRNYTMGLGFSYVNPKLTNSLFIQPLKWVNNSLSLEELNESGTSSLMLGCTGFTPDSLPATYVITNDRPYASLLFLQTTLGWLNSDNNIFWRTSFSVGILGTNISKATQIFIHEAMNDNDTKDPRTPRGWDHQISKNGEPTFQYCLGKKKLLLNMNNKCNYGMQLSGGWDLYTGYITGGSYGLSFRIGLLDSMRWVEDAGPFDHSNNIARSHPGLPSNRIGEFYYFLDLKPYFNIYNVLLSGQFTKNDYEIPWERTLLPVLGFKSGFGFKFPCTNFAGKICLISGRTPEFSQPGRKRRMHLWASIYLTF